MLAGVFLAGVNAMPTLVYGLIAGHYVAANALVGVVAHGVASGSAGVFVFFLLVAIQGVCMNVGRRLGERLALVSQLVFLLMLLAHAGSLGPMIRLAGGGLEPIAADPWLRALPAFWFLGLYDVIAGHPAPGSATLAIQALAATAAVIAIAAGLLLLTHDRLTRLALEGRGAGRLGGVRSVLEPLTALVCRRAAGRAVFGFTIRTLARSRSHRMLLGLYVSLAIALVLLTLGPLVFRFGHIALAQPAIASLAAPLVLLFFLLTGSSVMMAIPVEPKASWVFRLLEPADRVAAIDGARNALLALVVAPIALTAGAVAAWLWGRRTGLVHGLFCMAMGWLLAELLLMRVRKLPFTCTWLAGRNRARLWPFYLAACSTYSFTSAALELDGLRRPIVLLLLFLTLTIAIAALSRIRARALTAPPGLRFEEEDPEALFEGFRLSEGLAARARPPTRG
jgi:hypothetical protein